MGQRVFEKVVVGIRIAEPDDIGPTSVLAKEMALVCIHTALLLKVFTREVLATLLYWETIRFRVT